MIEINLLPEELRPRKKKEATRIPVAAIAMAAGALFAVLTVYFDLDFLAARSRMKTLEAQWQEVQPQALVLNQLKNEVENVLRPERDFLADHAAGEKILTSTWTWLSEYLPAHSWLTELKMIHDSQERSLVVKGLCLPSREKSSIEEIEGYLHQLKKKMKTAELSLTTSRQFIDQVELTHFTGIFQWPREKAR